MLRLVAATLLLSTPALAEMTLELPADASGAMVGYFANTGALARASVTVPYGR